MKYLHFKKLYNRYEEFETKNYQVSITSIINEFFKNSPKSVLKLIFSLSNIILNNGRVPNQWVQE